MAKKRFISTKFWSDSFIVELNPLDRYLFLYILTNEHTDICGIYELPAKVMSYETGIDADMLKSMLKRLAPKIYYIDGWIYIKNAQKHMGDSPQVKKGFDRCIALVPQHILAKIKQIDIEYPYSIDTVPIECQLLSLTPSLSLTLSPTDTCSSKMNESDFDTFWESYPLRKKKKVVKAKFLKLDNGLLPKMLKAIEVQKESEQWKKGFIPHPDTWINQERWEDEVTEELSIERFKKLRSGIMRNFTDMREAHRGSTIEGFDIHHIDDEIDMLSGGVWTLTPEVEKALNSPDLFKKMEAKLYELTTRNNRIEVH